MSTSSAAIGTTKRQLVVKLKNTKGLIPNVWWVWVSFGSYYKAYPSIINHEAHKQQIVRKDQRACGTLGYTDNEGNFKKHASI